LHETRDIAYKMALNWVTRTILRITFKVGEKTIHGPSGLKFLSLEKGCTITADWLENYFTPHDVGGNP
jgi:hypothetical protein